MGSPKIIFYIAACMVMDDIRRQLLIMHQILTISSLLQLLNKQKRFQILTRGAPLAALSAK